MELTIVQQILETIQKSTRLLIVLPGSPSSVPGVPGLHADALASGLALRLFLVRLGKEADVVCSQPIPEGLRFLPGVDQVKNSFGGSKNFVIVVDTTVKELDELSYQSEGGKVHIYLKPKDGQFTPEDVSFGAEKRPYDAVITLDVQTLEGVGRLFEENADVFFETPKINIDIHPGNEYYGAINLVDINATSIAEILAFIFEKFEGQLVDEDIATCLLAGIIAKTHSFQHSHTTPRAFLKASELIALGGRQQEVVRHLFKTKPLPLLRLWGRALARLKMHDDLPVIYSLLNLSDFGKAGASNEDLLAVLQELLDNVSGYKIVGLLSEAMGGNVRVLLAMHPQVSGDIILKALGDGASIRTGSANYSVVDAELQNCSITDAENLFLSAARQAAAPVVAE